MSTAIKGASYPFSILQSPLIQQPMASRLKLSEIIHQAISDWQHLAHNLTEVPVPITSLVPRAPQFVGAVDASQQGIGGFWLPMIHTDHQAPLAFRCPFPVDVQNQLVS